jgi:hemerythrin
MGVLIWNETMSVKVGSIDIQHKKLFDLINNFYDSINDGSSKDKLIEVIKGMKEYTVWHFSHEEKLMKSINYPAFAAHKAEHEKFVSTIIDYENRFKSGKLILSLEVTNFIKTWITNHIMGTDKKYTEFFVKNGIK